MMTRLGEDVEKLEPSYTAAGTAMVWLLWGTVRNFSKVKHRIITGPNNFTPVYPKGGKKDAYSKTGLHIPIAALLIITEKWK